MNKIIKAMTRNFAAISMFVLMANVCQPVIAEEDWISKFSAITEYLPSMVISNLTKTSAKELYCLALNNYYEAGAEGIQGMLAVSQVVMNRIDEKEYPDSACAVIHQRSGNSCQFSWACNKSKRRPDIDSDAWKNAVLAAKALYIDNQTVTGLENALYFHATHINPRWKRVVKVKRIGSHIFYRKIELPA